MATRQEEQILVEPVAEPRLSTHRPPWTVCQSSSTGFWRHLATTASICAPVSALLMSTVWFWSLENVVWQGGMCFTNSFVLHGHYWVFRLVSDSQTPLCNRVNYRLVRHWWLDPVDSLAGVVPRVCVSDPDPDTDTDTDTGCCCWWSLSWICLIFKQSKTSLSFFFWNFL